MAKQINEMETLFKALADATRLRILGLLLTGEVCVCHIHESLKIPQPKASRHLAYLRALGSGHHPPRRTVDSLPARHVVDPVVAAISDAVRHGLTHMDVVRRDAERLQKKTGCCLPSPDHASGLSCCSAVDAARRAPRGE